jgi:hypothetical protein
MDFDETLHRLCQDHDISVVYLFDVRAGGRPPGEDEAQVGLLFAQPTGSEQAKAVGPALLRSFQDLFGAERIGLAYLQEAGPLFQYQGIRGRLMYLADDVQRAEFEDRVVRDYLDFAYEIRLFQEDAAGEEDGG